MLDFIFCPSCGAPMADTVAFGRVRRRCGYCGFVQFKDPKVAVAAVISRERRVLLVRRAVRPRAGFWALPAGYMDSDELPEETLVREVAEETGITIRVLGLNTVVPLGGWQERRGILLVYWAEYIDGTTVAADDVSEVAWFEPGQVPWHELAFESTAQLLHNWIATLPALG
jgi:ADP-ribose pyrophosphatase YjhB (NUDIX family)